MTEADVIARDVVVHGYVQGVFFRHSCRQAATTHGVSGWVRNEYDGTVSAHFEGPFDAVGAMVRWVHDGPRAAVVQQVAVSESEALGLTTFDVR